jgi:hypothetical protein
MGLNPDYLRMNPHCLRPACNHRVEPRLRANGGPARKLGILWLSEGSVATAVRYAGHELERRGTFQPLPFRVFADAAITNQMSRTLSQLNLQSVPKSPDGGYHLACKSFEVREKSLTPDLRASQPSLVKISLD